MVDQTRDGPADVAAAKVLLPDGFAEAIGYIRAALAACSREGIPQETVLAALMAELMPMLSACYGPRGVSAVLGKVAAAMGDIAKAQEQRH
jgi:hypothetical protein